jgi:hypothetical protein
MPNGRWPAFLPGAALPPRRPAVTRRGLLRWAGAATAGLAAAGWRPASAGASSRRLGPAMNGEPPPPGPAATLPGAPRASTAPPGSVPDLDELAGEWMPAGTLLNMPSASNFHGCLHAGTNLLSFTELTFPPLSLGGECARLSLGGVTVQAHHSRWYPYQVLRRAQMSGFALRSAVRMGFEQPLVLAELAVTNTGSAPATASIGLTLGGYLRSYPGPWQWQLPRQYGDFSAWTGQVSGDGQVLTVTDGSSGAAAAFAFPTPPGQLTAAGSSGTAGWDLPLAPGETATIQLVMAAAGSADDAAAAAAAASQGFAGVFGQARSGWQQRFADAFTPGNGHFSGSLPVLATPDRELRRLYYASVLSVLALERTCYPGFFPRVYTTAGPQWGVTLTYFWDTSLFAPILVLLDPDMVREQVTRWLTLGIYDGYAVDALTGQLVGPWYSANDLSVFTMLYDYVTITGDLAFLDEQAGGTSVIDHMQAITVHWQQLVVPATGLADYGGQANLLEEVANYVNQVPSLNGANVWMMRQAAALRQIRGEAGDAQQLLALAQQLAGLVLPLYVPGQGVWQSVHDDGTRVPVRHIYDFDTLGRLLAGDLAPQMRAEMAAFVGSELVAGGWLRALSLSDPDAPASLRPDHGSNGAYDAWPALACGTLGSLGFYQQMLQLLHTFEHVTAEGPFCQSHELVPAPGGLVVWDRDDLNPVTALTVAAWINPVAWPEQASEGSIVAKDATAGVWFPTTPPNVGFTLRGGGAGVISFAVAVGGKFPQAVTTATVPVGGWHHVAGTFDGQHITVYIDGSQAATAAAKGVISPATGTNLMVAADPIDPQGKFTGAIDEVRLYGRALAAAEIAELAAATDPGYGGTDPALVLRLPMDEGSGEQTADAVTGQAETIIAAGWVPGRFGSALEFTRSAALVPRISRQQYNENNGGAFAAAVLAALFGWAPDGERVTLRDPDAPRGVEAALHGVSWRGRQYTITSGSAGVRLTPEP